MAKKKHTPTKTTLQGRITDAAVALGLLALSAELAVMAFVGSGLQAAIYSPLPQHKASTETRFDRQFDKSIIKAPVSLSFTACERRSTRIRNQQRRDQVLTLCHAKEKNMEDQK